MLFLSLLLAAEITADPRLPFLKGGGLCEGKEPLSGTLEAAGVAFGEEHGDEPGVRMRKGGDRREDQTRARARRPQQSD